MTNTKPCFPDCNLSREELDKRIKFYCLCEAALLEDLRKDKWMKCAELADYAGFARTQYYKLRQGMEQRHIGTLLKALYGMGVTPMEYFTILDYVWRKALLGEEPAANTNPKLIISKDNYPHLYALISGI